METFRHEEASTVKIHVETKRELENLRDYARETYEDIIRKLIAVYRATSPGLRDEVAEEIRVRQLEVQQGHVLTTKELRKRLGKGNSTFPGNPSGNGAERI